MADSTLKQEMELKRWENRRKMAWAAFKIASGLTIMLFVSMIAMWMTATPETIKAASQWAMVIVGMLAGLWGVVMAYIGTAAYSDVRLWNKE